MVKVLVALCIVAAVQVCLGYEVAVPVFEQPYGTGETRIINGKTATRGQFPHQAGLFLDGKSSFCGGSLISKNFVLTAAHCVDGFRSWSVVLGALNIKGTDEPGRVTVASRKGIKHEKFNKKVAANDVAVINLPEDVQLTETVNIINLPPKSYQNQDFAGQTVRVSGWGRTSESSNAISPTLNFVDLTLITQEECRSVFGDVITKSHYCCSGADKKSTCNGDSGGSLTIGSGKNLTNLGIVSFGSARGCAKGFPTGYTATPFFVDWISQKTGIPVSEF